MIRSTAEAICCRIALIGSSKPAIMIIVSSRVRASRGVLACRVVSDPPWPVFMAWSMSSVSAPRTLADDDPFGPHTQGVPDQVAGRDRPLAFDVRRPRFQPDHVVLLQLQFGRVLDRDHALVAGDEAATACSAASSCRNRYRREMRTFSRALMHASMQHRHLGRERLVVQQVFELERVGAEPADAEARPVQGERRDDRVDAGAVRQPGVHHRARLVHPPADLRHDPVDDLEQVVVVAERRPRSFPACRAARRRPCSGR